MMKLEEEGTLFHNTQILWETVLSSYLPMKALCFTSLTLMYHELLDYVIIPVDSRHFLPADNITKQLGQKRYVVYKDN